MVISTNGTATYRATSLWVGVVVYCLIRSVVHRRWMNAKINLVSSVVALFASLSWLGAWRVWCVRVQVNGFPEVESLKATLLPFSLVTVNEWAVVLILLLVFSVCLLLATEPVHFALGLASASFCVAAVLATFSRSAFLALLPIVIASVIALRGIRGLGLRSWARIAVFGLGLGLTFVGTNILSNGAVARTAAITKTEQQRRSVSGRMQLWRAAASIGSENILFGLGPGSFAMNYAAMADGELGQEFVGRPLNSWLGLWVEEGLAGLTLHLLVLAGVTFLAWRSLSKLSTRSKFLSSILLLGFWTFALKELTFSALFEVPLVMGLYWLLLAMSLNISERVPTMTLSRSWSLLVASSLVVASSFALVPAFRRYRAEVTANTVAELLNARDLNGSLGGLASGTLHVPDAHYVSLMGLTHGLVGMKRFASVNFLRDHRLDLNRSHLEIARSHYDHAITLNPKDSLYWHNRAWLKLALGAPLSDLLQDLETAIRLGKEEPIYRLSIGLLYEQAGQLSEARHHYSNAFVHAPGLVDSPFVRDLALRRSDLLGAAVEDAIADLRQRERNRDDVVVWAHLSRLYVATGDFESAKRLLGQVTFSMPQLSRPWLTLARISLEKGQISDVDGYLAKSMFIEPNEPLIWLVSASAMAKRADQARSTSHELRAIELAAKPVSSHARRIGRVYKTDAVIHDDVLPPGFLEYCSPGLLNQNLIRAAKLPSDE